MTGIILSPKDIFEQDFKRTMRGYDTKEVDEFLDDVIKDYETFTSQIEALKKEIEALKADKNELDTSSNTPVTPVYQASQSSYGTPVFNPSDVVKPSSAVTNFDILKRISRLEKEVFGKQIVE